MKPIMKYFKLILAINFIFLFEGYSQIQDSVKQKDSFLQKLANKMKYKKLSLAKRKLIKQ